MRARFAVLLVVVTGLAAAQEPPPQDEPLPEVEPSPPPPDMPPPDVEPRRAPGLLVVREAASAAAPARSRTIDIEVEDVALAELLAEIGRHVGAAIVVEPGIDERVTLSLREVPWLDAVELIARMCRCQLVDLPGGGTLVTQPATVTLRVVDGGVTHLLETIGRCGDEPVIIQPGLRATLSVDLVDHPWRSALAQVATAAGLEVTRGRGFTLVGEAPLPAVAPPGALEDLAPFDGPRIDVSARDADPADVAEAIGRLAGRNVLVDPAVETRVELELTSVPWGVAVHALAQAARCDVELHGAGVEGVLVLVGRARHVVRAVDAPAAPLLQLLARDAGRDLVVGPGVVGRVGVDLAGLPSLDALRVIAWSNGWAFTATPGASLAVTTSSSAPRRSASATPFDAQVDRLLLEIALLAHDRDVAPLERELARLRALVAAQREAESSSPAPPAPLDPGIQEDLEYRLSVLQEATEGLDADAISALDPLHALVERGGLAAEKRLRLRLAELEKAARTHRRPTVVRRHILVAAGQLENQAMDQAYEREDFAGVQASFERLEALVRRMGAEEEEVFHRDAEALLLHGRSRLELARRRHEIEARFGHLLRVQAIVLPGDATSAPAAIVSDQLVREGDTLVDPRTGEEVEGLRVVEVRKDGVRFRFEDTEMVRELGAPRPWVGPE